MTGEDAWTAPAPAETGPAAESDAAAPAAETDAATGTVRTGHPRLDAALDALERTSGLPPAEQIAEYDEAHRTLQETLATIDEGQS